jgi:hypothetical protein
VVICGFLLPLNARGQLDASSALTRMKRLDAQAMEAYENLEFEAAKDALAEALKVAREAGIKKGETLAQIYLDLGIVCGGGTNDDDCALRNFTDALRLNPEIGIHPTRATPTLEALLEKAHQRVRTLPPPPAEPKTLEHTPVDEIKSGKRIKIYAKISPDLEAVQVELYYRGSGSRAFEHVPMYQVRSGLYLGIIKGKEVKGQSLLYYLEAHNAAGQRVAGHGTRSSPNVVMVKGRFASSEEERDASSSAAPTLEQHFSLALMMGSGLGLIGEGESDHSHPQVDGSWRKVDIKPGGAITPFHLAPELMYHLNQDWQLSLLGRIQLVNAIGRNMVVSLLGEARVRRFFGQGALRFYGTLGAGGGQMRHRIELQDYDNRDETDNDRADTRTAGYLAAGIGGGGRYMFNNTLGLMVELNGLVLFPTFCANLDLNAGLLLSF